MPLRVDTRAGSHERRRRSLRAARCSGLGRERHGEVAVRGRHAGRRASDPDHQLIDHANELQVNLRSRGVDSPCVRRDVARRRARDDCRGVRDGDGRGVDVEVVVGEVGHRRRCRRLMFYVPTRVAPRLVLTLQDE